MSVQLINIITAAAAFMAAIFWLFSALVSLPEIETTDGARRSGTGVGMGQMNDNTYGLARSLRRQATWSKWGAASAGVAAAAQAILALGPVVTG